MRWAGAGGLRRHRASPVGASPPVAGLLPDPSTGPVVTVLLISADVRQATAFYRDVLGGDVVAQGPPPILRLANVWLQIAEPGGPTSDKPGVDAVIPRPDEFSAALNIRVADIRSTVKAWSAAGASFLTPPTSVPSAYRCFLRDPDGRLIELAQLTDPNPGSKT